VTFQVESYLTCAAADTVTLEVTFICSGSGSGYADSVIIVPGVNFWSVHNHNIDPGIVPTLYWSDDNAAFTSAGTATVYHPSFYVTLGAQSSSLYHRYWRGSFIGTNSTQTGTIWVGEFVLAQAIQLLKGPGYGTTEVTPNSVRIGQTPGHIWVLPHGTRDPRLATFKFLLTDAATYTEHRSELIRRVRMGVSDAVFVPLDSDPEVCLFGKMVDRKSLQQLDVAIWDADFGIIEQPTGVGIN
jgi:hypothetical protein